MSQPFVLLDEHKKVILARWESTPNNPPSLKELIELVFPGKDGRSQEGKAIQEYLATLNIVPKTTADIVSKTDTIALTQDQQDFIKNNCTILSVLEMTRKLYDDRKITNLDSRYRAVDKFLKTVPNIRKYDDIQRENRRYVPPKTLDQVIQKVNRYVYNGINPSKMTQQQTKQMYVLIGYLHKYGFIHKIESYNKAEYQNIFESSFIEYIYNKDDLTEEDLTIYINIADDNVKLAIADEQINNLIAMQETVGQDNDGKKLSMSITEQISDFHTEIQQIKTRQEKMIHSLQVKRADKVKTKHSGVSSLITMFEKWHFEENRKVLLNLAKLREQKLSETLDKLSEEDKVKAEFFGISKEEILTSL